MVCPSSRRGLRSNTVSLRNPYVRETDVLALILYPIILLLQIGYKVGGSRLLLRQRLHVMLEFLELEIRI